MLADAATLVTDVIERGRIDSRTVETYPERLLGHGMDEGEARAVSVANELGADLFLTDEFNSTNYLLLGVALEDRNVLFTTPHVLCRAVQSGHLDRAYVHTALTYYEETKGWDRRYVEFLREWYL